MYIQDISRVLSNFPETEITIVTMPDSFNERNYLVHKSFCKYFVNALPNKYGNTSFDFI